MIAKPHLKINNISTTFNPLQLATLYNFPKDLDGSNQIVGIIELGGGFNLSDITTYLTSLNISTIPNITSISIDGAINNLSDAVESIIEVILDIEVIIAIAPKAIIRVYFCPNSAQGYYNALNQSVLDGCKIVSMSWGSAEINWSSSDLTSFNELFKNATLNNNVTFFAAAGDNGSTDSTSGNNVDFPASSPYVVGCGGTSLTTNDNILINSEIVWNNNSLISATGGGISKLFEQPIYQRLLSYGLSNFRGVPDVSGNANPNTGYVIYAQGKQIIVGGTSAVSPLWSGLFCLINQSIGYSIGYIHPLLYDNEGIFRDIIKGNNGRYSTRIGWDPCSGLGSPNGQLLLNLIANKELLPVANFSGNVLLGHTPLTVFFTDLSTNIPTSWTWFFGDGHSSNLQNPKYTYSSIGTFTVILIATNSLGSNSMTRMNYITTTKRTT